MCCVGDRVGGSLGIQATIEVGHKDKINLFVTYLVSTGTNGSNQAGG